MGGWLYTEMVYLSTVTHPGNNQAGSKSNTLIRHSVLTTRPHHHQLRVNYCS